MPTLETLWTEKYRPKIIDDVILPETYRKTFNKYIEEDDIPNLLLVGERGTGKTTIANILIRHFIKDKSELLKINGSLDNSIDIVRERVITFLKIPPMYSKIKIIHYEEFDYVSRAVQPALRDPMETMIQNGRFILTCNYMENIIDPIKSRCQVFEFKELPKDKIFERLYKILKNENIKFKEEDLNTIVNKYYPSMRDMIQTLQMLSKSGELIIENISNDNTSDIIEKIESFLTNKSFKDAMKILREIDKTIKPIYIDYNDLVNTLYNDENIPFHVRAYMSALYSEYRNNTINHMIFIGILFKLWTFSSKTT